MHTNSRTRLLIALAPWALTILATVGCGPFGPATFPVSGKLDLQGGSSEVLAGSVIEASLVSDPLVRASGEVQPDGTFALETLHDGAIRSGAFEGTYIVRLTPPDDDAESRKRAAAAIHSKYLQFNQSGLTIEVAATDNFVTLPVTRR